VVVPLVGVLGHDRAPGVKVRRIRDLARSVLGTKGPAGNPQRGQDEPDRVDVYESLYEAHAQSHSDDDVVGAGWFEVIGRRELAILTAEGLTPASTLVDLGCGIGRMAVHAIPFLVGGHYIGTDVAPSMLERAQARIAPVIPDPPCRVSWVKQVGTTFAVPDQSVDAFCAYSVFTHIEHEDAFNFLVDARRAVRPGGFFVFSCLPMDLLASREIFLASAAMDHAARWSVVRNVTTTVDFMESIARLAGWRVRRWYTGDEENIALDGRLHSFGQSVCVLDAAAP
jgi:ubiquinone/menaquinone biosynthesis C-methylase UbiE